MSRGKSNRDIGLILAIWPATVKKRAQRIFDKIGVENRTSAASNIIAPARCKRIAGSLRPDQVTRIDYEDFVRP